MRLLFSSSQCGLVEEMGKRLAQNGILCEVRYRPFVRGARQFSHYKELWIEMDNQLQQAMSLVAMHCAIGRN
jgi:hypothetical protein